MRVLLDHELLTVKEAQQLLQVSRCTVNEMIDTGKLKAIKIGPQWKIEGKNLKVLLAETCQQKSYETGFEYDASLNVASNYESAMISEWT